MHNVIMSFAVNRHMFLKGKQPVGFAQGENSPMVPLGHPLTHMVVLGDFNIQAKVAKMSWLISWHP